MQEKIVISASRTKDLVRCSPELLCGMLAGENPGRFPLSPELHSLSLNKTGALVLWTKDPENILKHTKLRGVLAHFTEALKGVVVLNLTVTGLGGTVLEPGIPCADSVWKNAKLLLESGLVDPDAVILRYDPIIEVQKTDGSILGNISMPVFSRIAERFSSLGVQKVKTSIVDYRYTHVPERLRRLGLKPNLASEENLIRFIEKMRQLCTSLGLKLDLCCNPEKLITRETAGCIDGYLINRLLEHKGSAWRVTETPHNMVGRQRKACVCTYSRDIGHSPGATSCFQSNGACLYCYSQRNLHGPAMEMAKTLLKYGVRSLEPQGKDRCSD